MRMVKLEQNHGNCFNVEPNMVVNAMKEVDHHQVFCYLPDALVQLMKACVLHNNIAKSLSFVTTSILAI